MKNIRMFSSTARKYLMLRYDDRFMLPLNFFIIGFQLPSFFTIAPGHLGPPQVEVVDAMGAEETNPMVEVLNTCKKKMKSKKRENLYEYVYM